MSHTYKRNGIAYCNLCGLDLTKTRAMQLAHTCGHSDLVAQCFAYREMLDKFCTEGVPVWDSSVAAEDDVFEIKLSLINEARELIGLETIS
jgi:hypothetical protein